MSLTLSRPSLATQTVTVAVWRAQPGAYLVLGRASGPIPKAGSARVAAALGGVGVFRAEFWPLADHVEYAFLAVVRLPSGVDPAINAELALRGARNGDKDFRLKLIAASQEVDFGTQSAVLSRGHEAKLARFLLDMVRPDERDELRRSQAVLTSFLAHAARPDGCVELILNRPGKFLLLQGWGTRPDGALEILLGGQRRVQFSADVCEFPRDDVQRPATGIVLVLPPEASDSLLATNVVFLLAGEELLSRQIVEPQMLSPAESVGQIRHLLPRLICDPVVQQMLRELTQPEYEGHDTLSGNNRPVRAAVDLAVSSSGSGVYLSGWLFDPAAMVKTVEFCTAGKSIRLDTVMVRIPRDDVTEAFRVDPFFPSPLNALCGFAVSAIEALKAGAAGFLRVTFTDGDVAFMPVRLLDLSSHGVMERLLGSVDLHKQSGTAVIQEHLGPFIAAAQRPRRESGRLALTGPIDRAKAIVVPLRGGSQPRPIIASFLTSPLREDEQILFVCGPEWAGTRLDYLIDLISFYRLPASVVVFSDAPRPTDAIFSAVEIFQSEFFLLVSADVCDLTSDFRDRLYDAGATNDVVCPTILYEDGSVRFAGSSNMQTIDRAPYARILIPAAGLPAASVAGSKMQDMTGGTFACCMLRKSVATEFWSNSIYFTDVAEELHAFHTAKSVGRSLKWLQSTQIIVPDGTSEALSPIKRLVDGWTLRHRRQGAEI